MSMRPQVLSYLLIAVTTAAWLRTREDGQGALVAGAADLGVGDGPRHVAGRHHHRPRRRWSASPSTAQYRAATWLRAGRHPAALDRGRRRAHPGGPAPCTPPCSGRARAASTSPSGSRRTSRDADGIALLVLRRRSCSIGMLRRGTVRPVDRAAPAGAGRRLGALHRPHRERGRHDARPPRRHGAPGCAARAARPCGAREILAVLGGRRRVPGGAGGRSSRGPRTSRRPRPRLVRRPRRPAGRHRRCSTTGARAAT